jgi:hypothetical protein
MRKQAARQQSLGGVDAADGGDLGLAAGLLGLARSPEPPPNAEGAVAGDDQEVVVDDHRVDEPELPDRSSDLLDLALGVGARVARAWLQRLARIQFHRT